MSDNLFIPIIQDIIRKKRQSIHVSKLLEKTSKQIDGIETVLVDPVNFDIKHDGNDESNKVPKYSEITAKADAFFIVSPQYNNSFPGLLKRLLDDEKYIKRIERVFGELIWMAKTLKYGRENF